MSMSMSMSHEPPRHEHEHEHEHDDDDDDHDAEQDDQEDDQEHDLEGVVVVDDSAEALDLTRAGATVQGGPTSTGETSLSSILHSASEA
jgi:hypothetical protein